MKRLFYVALMVAFCSSCHRSLEDRAAQECKEFTEKKCPTPVVDNVRMDSMVFEPATQTIHYYHTLVFNFHYTYHSEKKPSEVLFDVNYNTKDYQ